MKVACTLLREGGTHVDLNDPDVTYHFKPDPDTGKHVADVKVKSHVKILLAIPEAYEPADFDEDETLTDTKKETTTSTTQNESVETVLQGLDWEPKSIEYGEGKSVLTADLVNQAFSVSGLTKEQWNLLTKAEVEEKLSAEVDTLKDNQTNPDSLYKEENEADANKSIPDAPANTELGADDKGALVVEAKKLGVKSPHLMGVPKLKEAIAAKKAAASQ